MRITALHYYLIIIMLTVTGCSAFQYGYESIEYEKKLVGLNSDWGKRRLKQIVNYDSSVMSLISSGYNPEFLYEVNEDDFYFIAGTMSYRLIRAGIDTDSSIIKLTTIPQFILDSFDQYDIKIPSSAQLASKTVSSSNKPNNHIDQIQKTISNKHLSATEVFAALANTVYKIQAISIDKSGKPKNIFQGSGVMISPHHMVTNYHVIDKTDLVISFDKEDKDKIREWQVLAFDINSDLALLYNKGKHPYVSKLKSINEVEIGQKVYAIGSPEGLENTLSEGIISGKRGENDSKRIQTTASITHGSSGGALFSEFGELVGITTEGLEQANLNFAITTDSINGLLTKLKINLP